MAPDVQYLIPEAVFNTQSINQSCSALYERSLSGTVSIVERNLLKRMREFPSVSLLDLVSFFQTISEYAFVNQLLRRLLVEGVKTGATSSSLSGASDRA